MRIETAAARYVDTIAQFFGICHREAVALLSPVERACARLEIMLATRPVRVIIPAPSRDSPSRNTMVTWKVDHSTPDYASLEVA